MFHTGGLPVLALAPGVICGKKRRMGHISHLEYNRVTVIGFQSPTDHTPSVEAGGLTSIY